MRQGERYALQPAVQACVEIRLFSRISTQYKRVFFTLTLAKPVCRFTVNSHFKNRQKSFIKR